MSARVLAVSRNGRYGFSKPNALFVRLRAGLGVEGDVHAGETVKHRSRVAKDPSAPNLRQVHLMHAELFAELAAKGFAVAPGQLGENITTEGLDLLALPEGTLLRLGAAALLRITGLRNPCLQLDRFAPGLMQAVLDRAPDGALLRKAGVMAVVLADGEVWPGDAIAVIPPEGPARPLRPV